jgi:predicted dehydrogenase
MRIGLVGFGAHMAENLYPALRLIPGVRIVAMASRDGVRARSLAAQYDIPRATDSWRELIRSDDLDALVVSATPQAHSVIAGEALAGGVNVFVEKPPAPDLPTLSDLARLEARSAARAFVGYNFRFAELVRRATELVTQAQELRCLKIRFVGGKPRTPLWECESVEESFLYAVAIHAIDLALTMLGPPTGIMASHAALGGGRFSMTVVLDFAEGRQAVLDLGNYSSRFEFECELIGAAGLVARVSDLRRMSLSGHPTSSLASRKEETAYQLSGLSSGFAASGYTGAFAAFFDAIGSGTPSPSPLGASLAVYEVIRECLSRIP